MKQPMNNTDTDKRGNKKVNTDHILLVKAAWVWDHWPESQEHPKLPLTVSEMHAWELHENKDSSYTSPYRPCQT